MNDRGYQEFLHQANTAEPCFYILGNYFSPEIMPIIYSPAQVSTIPFFPHFMVSQNSRCFSQSLRKRKSWVLLVIPCAISINVLMKCRLF